MPATLNKSITHFICAIGKIDIFSQLLIMDIFGNSNSLYLTEGSVNVVEPIYGLIAITLLFVWINALMFTPNPS